MADEGQNDTMHTGPGGKPGPVSPFKAGLGCRCPYCGKGALFPSFFSLALNERCADCGRDLSSADPGDGPAVFVILILGAIVTIAAIIVEVKIAPPTWVHIILWPVFVSGLGLWMLRVFKGILFALQVRHDAHEGRLHDDE
ncbi:DUF983 domain-containing protein [Gimibacter soli]|uniref:DUF983 domain-containing protein n=1 Tax=Gimibacter soli TaxID=3024400 RepID=A0AAE9XVG3_9PROT|nr:DUF983 domain-containing protein [Gimibacter soli]WCL53649.1 DUF983 domain-containing protein [Gimibacter soli]